MRTSGQAGAVREPENEIGNERRLGDRIVFALELALEQGDLEVCELLGRALEAVLTRFGGLDRVDQRELPAAVESAFLRLDELRHRRRSI